MVDDRQPSMIEERADTSNPDLPAESVTIDRTVLFAVMDDMADAALALGDANDAHPAERTRCREALRVGIAQLWMQANLSEFHPGD